MTLTTMGGLSWQWCNSEMSKTFFESCFFGPVIFAFDIIL